jgi:hypothetical protein
MTNRMLLTLVLVPIAAGCGSNNPTTSTGGSSAQAGQNRDVTAAYAYARCMRSHGVPNFPDPHVSISSGGGSNHGSVGFAVNPSETGSPKWGSAQHTCSKILPAPASPAQERAEQEAHKHNLLAFARCVRSKGIRNFPDPNTQGQLPLPSVIAAGIDIHSRRFLDAATGCAGVTHGEITAAQIRAGVNATH